MAEKRDLLRIANCSGFYGDRLSAAREMVEGGPIDVLTGDYLAELTMLILWKDRQRNPDGGYAASFPVQMRDVLATCLARRIKVVVNAGGLNPAGLAAKLSELAGLAGLRPKVAHVVGDDLLQRLPELQRAGHPLAHLGTGQPLAEAAAQPVTANAYLGGWGIAAALRAGADVVICGRVSDASLVVGPAAWAFDWACDDWDRLAGAVTAGHIIECGAQATGGNFSFFTELAEPVRPGFPIAELAPDGSCVITKHPGTGGAVTVDTVTAQLLYEIGAPAYLNPDVVARFDTVTLAQDGPDRVRVAGVRGEPAPDTLKVCLNYRGGYRNSATFLLTGLDIEAKARYAERSWSDAVGGRERFAEVDVRLTRTDTADAETNAEAVARLTITVKDPEKEKAGRAFFAAVAEAGLSSYPGFFVENLSAHPTEYGVHWPALIPVDVVHQQVVLSDGTVVDAPRPPARPFAALSGSTPRRATLPPTTLPPTATLRAPLGTLVGARSGDKGGDANVGLWARSDEAYGWLRDFLDLARFRTLLPEAAALPVTRYELPNLRAVNFVVHGLLGEGVAASTRPDPQAKALGEYLRSRLVEIPTTLLPG
ncbi:acyclic terpene utilization AtuA family protein [Micromonospora sp. NPDC049679]|uniref:acyclic terpene utilization AtuA family protein n=1 Tax=Micromonospora sp. NPDC049679 TaxID=3155920 RepID=UPI0033CF6A98